MTTKSDADDAVLLHQLRAFNERQHGFRKPRDFSVPRETFDAVVRAISARCKSAGHVVDIDGMEELPGTYGVLRWTDEPREHIAFKGVKMFPMG